MGESLKQTFERLPSKCTISEIVSANPSFDKCAIKVLYDGLNRNRTYISKESIEEAIPSIFNIPIVCHYIKSGDEVRIGGHDEEFDQDGKSVNLTQPVGVIPESANYWWEDIVDGGKKHTYFCVEGILWKRQDAYNFIKSQGSLGQSMEINILICHSEASYSL